MVQKFLLKFFKSRNERVLTQYRTTLEEINNYEKNVVNLTNDEIKTRSLELKQLVISGKKTLNDVKVEAFAICREMSKRILGMRHFDVQIIGGLTLHEGKIAEMRTGEGKTLVATLAAYLNALSGKGVHVFTVNDYLAERDSKINAPLFEALGLTVGAILSSQNQDEKIAAYKKDIVYGTNSEFGFDYLRNNLVHSMEEKVQGELNYAIIDEVDSILIDEARTPLIISDIAEESSELFVVFNEFAKRLVEQTDDKLGHFIKDEEKRQINITELGYEFIEKELISNGFIHNHYDMYNDVGLKYLHYINNALKAHHLFFIDQQYIVKEGQVIIVDEFTGRLADGRRWSDGQHQAIEAKENVEIQKETKTIATITYQNFFLLYPKLAGMTGTAITEAQEFYNTYKLETITIPTNRPVQRIDHLDIIYYNFDGKIKAIIEDIQLSHKKGQPVLVGTASIESSELISHHLSKVGIPHQVLNAKYHALEAEIIAQAGKLGAVTIATNMAGRGTDIILGGNIGSTIKNIEADEALTTEEQEQLIQKTKEQWQLEHNLVIKAGGLKVIGVEKNESRRIDNQLRGRAGRQGEPGESIFYLSLDDNLFRIFGGDRIKQIMVRLTNSSDDLAPIQSKFITKVLHDAQVKIENNNYNIRKSLMEYDTILNEQRIAYYRNREEILIETKMEDYILHSFDQFVEIMLSSNNFINDYDDRDWDWEGLKNSLLQAGLVDFANSDKFKQLKQNDLEIKDIKNSVLSSMYNRYHDNKDLLINIEKIGFLTILDNHWQNHLSIMAEVKNFIHLRGYAQKDPKQEYKKEAHTSFLKLFEETHLEYAQFILHGIVQIIAMQHQIIEQQRLSQEQSELEIKEDNILD